MRSSRRCASRRPRPASGTLPSDSSSNEVDDGQSESRNPFDIGGNLVKALITGGAGFIGSHLSELLLADGEEVFVLDDLSTGSLAIVEQLVRTLRVNLEGTETVLDACCRFDKPVLVASTSEVYGDHRSEEPLRETSRRIYGATTQKRWAYADSKAMDEFLALAYHEEHDLKAVIVRLFNTVGPRQTGMYGMVIPRFAERALAGAPI